NGNYIIFFRVIVVNHALSVDGREFNLPHQVDGGDYSLSLRINHSGAMAVAVKRIDMPGDRFIDDGVGVGLACRDLAGHLQRLQIEKHNLLESRTRPRITV